ncbi:hypothetical protein M422DRAFT_30866 [Sphaerobolus stellatus SS14]|uniref:Uncharacterized protein n=1 Tax=Sphaerobolus stellatus (strain SS14) TaxID=990650 RepID=A0A0C9VY51_SPHS4|nr:hypothetical protein M422DRAFT_30866 [Sphaerobolus stellatus SS14]
MWHSNLLLGLPKLTHASGIIPRYYDDRTVPENIMHHLLAHPSLTHVQLQGGARSWCLLRSGTYIGSQRAWALEKTMI